MIREMTSEPRRRVLSAILFSPRGGSSHAARALARELPAQGWHVTLLSGSQTGAGPEADARVFYAGLDVRPVDFTGALRGPDPVRHRAGPGEAPMHPSFEDRPGAPDRVFAELDDLDAERHVAAWATALHGAGAARADVLHLHHLTPLNEAAARVAPHVPVVGHLHGTELLMLEQIDAGAPPAWRHAERWAERMRGWAADCGRLVAATPDGAARAARLLGVERERIALIPNGFDPARFAPAATDRLAQWRRRLVESPQGWLPGEPPGSVRYADADLDAFASGPVLVFVGRFTEVKRLPLLIGAYANARERFTVRAPLVLVGGYPGEWEGEHPAEAVRRLGVPDVFLAGWHEQAALPGFLRASDCLVLPSVRESFGQVIVEAMACGLPVVAADRFGPAAIVEHGETGWLVEPDDERALADALVDVVNRPQERVRRGRLAREAALDRFSWDGIAADLAAVFEATARDAGAPFARAAGA